MFRLALYELIKKRTQPNDDKSFFSHDTKSFADKASSKLNELVKSCSCPNFNTKTVPNNDIISG